MHHLLIADDDRILSDLLADYLRGEGFEVEQAFDGDEAIRVAEARTFDLIILDVMMPGQSGLDVLRILRRHGETPVLMLTARGDDIDRIVGLELGADDYLGKPANPRELSARIRAILRRTDPTTPASIRVGALRLYSAARQASVNDAPLALTATEFDLLLLLCSRAGEVITKAEISQQVLGKRLGPHDRSTDVHISNLRRKLEEAGMTQPIRTVRGVGYMLPAADTN
jgi:two-component system response regulator CpxR